jgi:endonuclease-3
MSKGTLKQKAYFVLNEIEKIYPDAKSELENWSSAFQFLVCVVLSAQATDKGVNKVTGKLFQKYPTSLDLANAELAVVIEIIKSINFFNNKAKNILNLARMLEADFGGIVPGTIEELVKLPGVGYKTANVVLSGYFKQNSGIAVDTHVARVVSRLDLVSIESRKDATKIAKELENLYDKDDWNKINSELVLFGRYICKAKVPNCDVCPMRDICGYYAANKDEIDANLEKLNKKNAA